MKCRCLPISNIYETTYTLLNIKIRRLGSFKKNFRKKCFYSHVSIMIRKINMNMNPFY